jgi:cytochrome o ubiquinol oxidase subunit 1
VNAVFGILSTVIAVPTGVKVFNWLFTIYGGRVRYNVPILWAIGFMVTFVLGGMTGVLLALPPVDFLLHNSLFLIAHFHNVIIGGVVFALFAGYTYWFPKAFGFRLHEGLGKAAFWFWTSGFYLAFMPLYVLGFLGMTRRMQEYDVPAWQPWLIAAAAGAGLIAIGTAFLIAQLVYSIRHREALADLSGDPWDGRTLEWSTSSPPPSYNFAVLPEITALDAHWVRKQQSIDDRTARSVPSYVAVEVPRNSATGITCAFFATLMGFALIWHIWWLAALGFVGALATFVVFAWRDRVEDELTADELSQRDGVDRAARDRASNPRLAA